MLTSAGNWAGVVDLRTLAETLPALVFVTDEDGDNLYTNSQFQTYVGVPAESLLGGGWLMALHPDDRDRARAIWGAAVATGEPYVAQYRLRSADGDYRWHAVRGTPLREGGRTTCWVGLCTDIDDAKRAELATAADLAKAMDRNNSARRGAEELAERLLNATNDCVNTLTPDGRLLSMNGPGLAAMGLDNADPLVGHPWPNFWRSAQGRAAAKTAVETASRGGIGRFTGCCRTARKSDKWWDVAITPVRDARGEIERLLCVARDVTAQRETEAALVGARERLEFALQGINEGLWDWNVETGQVWFSERWCTMLGYDPSEVEPHVQSWEKLVHPDDLAEVMRVLKDHLDGRTPFYVSEHRVRTKSGTWLWIADRGQVVERAADGRALRAVGTHCDITARKSAELTSAFRLSLSESLRKLSDPELMMDAACQALGRHLGVAQVGFAEVDDDQAHIVVDRDWGDGRIPSVAGRWRMDDFGPAVIRELKMGKTIAIPDVAREPHVATPEILSAYDRIATRAVLARGLIRDGRLVATLFIHHNEPRAWSLDDVAIVGEASERLWSAVEHARAERRLQESEERFRALVEATAEIVWTTDPEGPAEEDAPAWQAFTGQSAEEIRGAGWLDAVHPDDRDRAWACWQHSIATGETYQVEYRLRDRDGGWRWTQARAVALRDRAGAVKGWVGMNADVSARHEAEEQLQLVNAELHHRVKNTLAIVQAIARATARGATSIEAFEDDFDARVAALARSHELLLAGGTAGASLEAIIQAELQPYDDRGGRRVKIDGPSVALPSAVAVPVGMAIHELTTNAAKYGALRAVGGVVQVGWSVHDGMLELNWIEQGGPEVKPPARRGFGSQLLERMLGTRLKAKVEREYAPSGLRVKVTLPFNQ